jgi:hypothetical protein
MSNALVTMSVYLESLFSDERCSRERETGAAVTNEFLTGTSAVRSLNCGSRFRQKLLYQRFAVAVCTDLERADQCRIAYESKLCYLNVYYHVSSFKVCPPNHPYTFSVQIETMILML